MTADIRGDGLGRTYDTQGIFRGRTDNIRGDRQLTLGGRDKYLGVLLEDLLDFLDSKCPTPSLKVP